MSEVLARMAELKIVPVVAIMDAKDAIPLERRYWRQVYLALRSLPNSRCAGCYP